MTVHCAGGGRPQVPDKLRLRTVDVQHRRPGGAPQIYIRQVRSDTTAPVPQYEGHPRQRGGVRAQRRPGEPERGRGEGEGGAGSEGKVWPTEEELQPALNESQQVQLVPRRETAQQVRTSGAHQDQGGKSAQPAQSSQSSLQARQTSPGTHWQETEELLRLTLLLY